MACSGITIVVVLLILAGAHTQGNSSTGCGMQYHPFYMGGEPNRRRREIPGTCTN